MATLERAAPRHLLRCQVYNQVVEAICSNPASGIEYQGTRILNPSGSTQPNPLLSRSGPPPSLLPPSYLPLTPLLKVILPSSTTSPSPLLPLHIVHVDKSHLKSPVRVASSSSSSDAAAAAEAGSRKPELSYKKLSVYLTWLRLSSVSSMFLISFNWRVSIRFYADGGWISQRLYLHFETILIRFVNDGLRPAEYSSDNTKSGGFSRHRSGFLPIFQDLCDP